MVFKIRLVLNPISILLLVLSLITCFSYDIVVLSFFEVDRYDFVIFAPWRDGTFEGRRRIVLQLGSLSKQYRVIETEP